MKIFVVFCCLLAASCGEKRNPDRCCVDEADCAAIGLPNGSTCQPGELCRGNECVEQTCTTSAQCDPSAPYCEEQHCAEMCTTDASCPVTSPTMPYCVSGGCVQCRETADCGDLVCRNGTCGGCAADGECASGVCLVSVGTCVEATDVAFVSVTGSPTSNCLQSAPCTLLRALTIDPPRTTIKLSAGTYSNTATMTLEGKRVISGDGPTTRITNTATGPIFVLGTSSDISLERMEIFGAKNGAEAGVGVRCSTGTKLRLSEVSLTTNASDGVLSTCSLTMTRSSATNNTGFGIRATGDASTNITLDSYAIDRSRVSNNTGGGINATGRGTIQNAFVALNSNVNLQLTQTNGVLGTRPQVSFTTVFGAMTGVACAAVEGPQIPVTNTIIQATVNNPMRVSSTSCAISNCVTRGLAADPGCVDSQFLLFVDEANGDFHLANSLQNPAINGASGGTGLLDFDGELRPKGVAADIGADEAQ